MVLLGVIEFYDENIKSDGKSGGMYGRCRQTGETGMLILSHCKV